MRFVRQFGHTLTPAFGNDDAVAAAPAAENAVAPAWGGSARKAFAFEVHPGVYHDGSSEPPPEEDITFQRSAAIAAFTDAENDAGAEAVARAVAAREAALAATAAVSGRIVVSSRLPDGAPPPPPLAASSGARAPPDASPTLRLRQLQGGGLPGELDGEGGSFLLG